MNGVQRSEMAINVDQFVVTDDVNAFALLAIEDGIVKIVNAMIEQAQIENLFVKGEQIEPGAVSIAKSTSIPSNGGGGYIFDFTINHGLNLQGTHHEMRVEFRGTATVDGSQASTGQVSVTDLATGDVIVSDARGARGPNHPSGALTAVWSIFSYFQIPAGNRQSTTVRFRYVGSLSFSVFQAGFMIFKNVPDDT